MLNRASLLGAVGLLLTACSGSDVGGGGREIPGATGGTTAPTSGGDQTGSGGFVSQPPPTSTGGSFTGGATASGGATGTGGAQDCTMTRCDSDKLDEVNCGYQEVKGDVQIIEKPGNVLMVYDRSGSMEQRWNGTSKYEAAGNAIIRGIEPLQDLLTVGAVFFPSLDPNAQTCQCNPVDFTHWLPGGCCLMGSASSCFVSDISQPDQISFRPAPAFITELPNQWQLQGAGNTPLQDGLREADAAIANTTFDGSLSIVIVTDGQPNCGTDDQAVLSQISAWRQAGYRTYVVGLPGAQGAADLLNAIAQAGGSGNYIDPSDPANLEAELRDIVQDTISGGIDSCTINLTPPAEAPEKLRLVVSKDGVDQGVDRMLSATAGWNVTADGSVVTLEGDLCDQALAGAYDSLRFDFGCVDLPQLPPPVLE